MLYPKPIPAPLRRTLEPAVTAGELLTALEHGDRIGGRCVAVVAHPDDETISIGSRLALFDDLDLVQVTDGAPMAMADALKAGFSDRESYARARRGEVEAALAALGARPRQRCLQVRDQEAIYRIEAMVIGLLPLLRGATALMTHAYEGGHPDHDACALAVQLACERLDRAAPVRLEFASYHLQAGEQASQAFWPQVGYPPVQAMLTPAQRQAKRKAFAAFASQADVMAWFSPELERFRAAPHYDFARPPPPDEVLYDRWGWALTSAVWRREAARHLTRRLA